MALQPVAFVDGRSYAAEDVRRLVYAATDGATGVVKSGHLSVRATSTPSTQVIINAGVGYVASTFAPAQGYIVSNDAAFTVDVPPNNTSSPIYWRVCILIEDAQYAGMPVPSNPSTALYCRVNFRAAEWDDRPYLYLGLIKMPPNTATVTPDMIVPRWQVARPRTYRIPHIAYPSGDVNMKKSTTGTSGTEYAPWPRTDFTVDVPLWATKLYLVTHVNGVEYTGTDVGQAGVRGYFGNVYETQNGILTSDGKGRQTIVCASTFDVPESVRGGTAVIGLQALQTLGAGNFQIDYQSQIVYDADFRDQ